MIKKSIELKILLLLFVMCCHSYQSLGSSENRILALGMGTISIIAITVLWQEFEFYEDAMKVPKTLPTDDCQGACHYHRAFVDRKIKEVLQTTPVTLIISCLSIGISIAATVSLLYHPNGKEVTPSIIATIVLNVIHFSLTLGCNASLWEIKSFYTEGLPTENIDAIDATLKHGLWPVVATAIVALPAIFYSAKTYLFY